MFDYLYILKDKKPVLCRNLAEWAQWFDKADRTVNYNIFIVGNNPVEISTVFAGIDGLFETRIFGGEHDGKTFISDDWEEAELTHEIAKEIIAGKRC